MREGLTKPLAALSAAQATDLALRLANEKAQALYQCRPYTNGPAALLRIRARRLITASSSLKPGDGLPKQPAQDTQDRRY
jgi:hypothetical protein